MSIIVTGGLGFIGSNLVRELNNRGFDKIYIVDRIEANHGNIKDLKYVDFIDKDNFENIKKISDIEIIFHQGAITDTTVSDEKLMYENNLAFSQNVYKLCQEKNARLIYASTAAVYGLGENGFKEQEVCENPLNVYGLSKLKFDNYIRKQNCKTQVVGLRYFNVFGPGENYKGKMASPINQFFHQAMSSGEIKVFEGSNNFHRDFIYIDDVVNVNMHFFENPNLSGIFNCGTGKTSTFQDAANIVSTSLKVPIKTVPFPDILKQKYQAYTCSDLTALQNSGYQKQFINFDTASKDYINSMLKLCKK